MTTAEEGIVYALSARSISKRFGGTQALNNVSFDVEQGVVHSFVGENGAGKSTIGKIVSGLYSLDEGQLSVFDHPVGRWNTTRAQKHGVVMIAQELSLVPEMSVEQNIFLGVEEHGFGLLKPGIRERFDRLNASIGFDLDPDTPVVDLPIALQQKVEIMRALAREAKIIVMDEPTSSLTGHEVQQLHEVIDQLRSQGRTVIYVSHFLDAVLEVSDHVSIMRNGEHVRTSPAREETKSTLIQGMLGKPSGMVFPTLPAHNTADEPILQVTNISNQHGIRKVSLQVRPGEIVGLLGLVGAGRTEIARAIAGIDRVSQGKITFKNEAIENWTIQKRIRHGLVYVPEDRHKEGLMLDRDVIENITLPHLRHGLSRAGFILQNRARRQVDELSKNMGLRPHNIDLPVRNFSGGNQQKVLLSKWMYGGPDLIVLDEPTRGVDVGAKEAIYQEIIKFAEQGIGVIIISSEHEEVLNLSHRAYIVHDGQVLQEVDPSQTSIPQLLQLLFAAGKDWEEERV